MIKRKLKPVVVPSLYILIICIFCLSIYLLSQTISNILFDASNETYVSDEITNINDSTIPVIATDTKIIRPYVPGKADLFKEFYNSEADAENQEESLYFYEDTYMQNTGSDYKGNESFDIISVLDGTVTKIEENEILGTSIEIKHTNDLVSIYQSVSEVTVKEGDTVLSGQIIAKSGKCNLNPDVDNMLHFELSYKGIFVNPEEYFDKSLSDL